MYERDKVREAALKYFNGNELLSNIWIDKYCLKDLSENLLELTPKDMHKRIAKELYRIEKKYENPISYEEILSLLEDWTIIPGGSLLYGVGNNYSISSLGNCFVIGNDADSYGGICTTDQEQVQLMKRRAGVGHDLSHLRRAKALVTNAAGTSTGPVSYMPRYSNSTREVAQDGRRGALMMSMNIEHDDSPQFIESKNDLTKITGANISVKISDAFMENVRDNINNRPKVKIRWDKLIHQSWKTAEPGVLFWDTIIRESPADCYEGFKSKSTNPCGEIPLCPYDSCRLMSVNLYNCIDNPFTDKASVNWNKLNRVTYIAQRMMDNIVDLEEEKIDLILNKINNDPESEEIKAIEKNLWLKIKEKLLQGRRTGLSGIGLADLLASVGIPYSSSRGIQLAEEVYKKLAIAAYRSSINMAKERGAFPIYSEDDEMGNPFIERIYKELDDKTALILGTEGRRNIALLTIPPSGTISLLADISSGIEPVYQLHHKRRRKVNEDNPNISFIDKNGDCWEEYNVIHPKFKDYILSTNNMEMHEFESIDWEMSLGRSLIEESPYYKSTAYELNPLDRVKMQSVIQKWIDHSISSTVNLPESATEEDISNIFITAWKEGLKGITVYRDKCRDGVLLSIEDKKQPQLEDNNAAKRPKELPCDIFTTTAKGIQYNMVIGLYQDRPYEVFGTTNLMTKEPHIKGNLIKVKRGHYKVNGDINRDHLMENMSDYEKTVTRLVSGQLRHNRPIKYIVEDILKLPGDGFNTFNKALARILKKYIKNDEVVTGIVCENCGSSDLVYKEGCRTCNSCGSSLCG